jgi:hypothetical protein
MRAADDRAHRQQHDIEQGVELVPLHPWVFKSGEVLKQTGRHERLLTRFLSILP